jgi:hypothetical protein
MRNLIALAVLAAVLATGCRAKFPTAPVTGLVTLDGKPLTRGKVVFIHETAPVSGEGVIGPDGRYKLDAPVGNCRIAVQCRELPNNDLPREMRTPSYYMSMRSLIPERYEDHMRNGLKLTVQDGNNTMDLPLTK